MPLSVGWPTKQFYAPGSLQHQTLVTEANIMAGSLTLLTSRNTKEQFFTEKQYQAPATLLMEARPEVDKEHSRFFHVEASPSLDDQQLHMVGKPNITDSAALAILYLGGRVHYENLCVGQELQHSLVQKELDHLHYQQSKHYGMDRVSQVHKHKLLLQPGPDDCDNVLSHGQDQELMHGHALLLQHHQLQGGMQASSQNNWLSEKKF